MAAGYVVPGVAVMLAQRRQDLQISGVTFFDDFAYWCDRGVDGDRIYRFRGQSRHRPCRITMVVYSHGPCRQLAAGEKVSENGHIGNATVWQFRLAHQDRGIGVLRRHDVLQRGYFLLDRDGRVRPENRVIDFIKIGAEISHSAAVVLSASGDVFGIDVGVQKSL